MIPFEPPYITARSTQEQVQQLIRYLQQLAEQLNRMQEQQEVKLYDQN